MAVDQLVIAPAAKVDLKEIYQYGLRQWGQTQSDSYLQNLQDHFWSLKEHPLKGIRRSKLLPDIRSLPIESHVLYYRATTDKIEIIRVLHARQDPWGHLK